MINQIMTMTIYLGLMLPLSSSTLPENEPKREASEPKTIKSRLHFPIWACTEWGLPCHLCHQKRGELLPRHFTLTPKRGGIFSVALSTCYQAWTLSSIPLFGARTFLCELLHSSHPLSYYALNIEN